MFSFGEDCETVRVRPYYAIGFDLDDTIYNERDYREGAYRSLSQRIANEFNVDAEWAFNSLKRAYEENGDREVFQVVMREVGVQEPTSSEFIREVLIPGYRTWSGPLHPFPAVIPTLTKLRSLGLRLGLITNGGSATQWNKIRLLGIEPYFDSIIVTGDHLPRNQWKPHPAPFRLCFDELGIEYRHCLYVGNNPSTDVPGAREIGATVIIVPSCPIYQRVSNWDFLAIESLDELLRWIPS